jgi:hypothetical protein
MPKPQDKRLEDNEPAKGGTEPAKEKSYPSGDSPKPHGDKLGDAVENKKR